MCDDFEKAILFTFDQTGAVDASLKVEQPPPTADTQRPALLTRNPMHLLGRRGLRPTARSSSAALRAGGHASTTLGAPSTQRSSSGASRPCWRSAHPPRLAQRSLAPPLPSPCTASLTGARFGPLRLAMPLDREVVLRQHGRAEPGAGRKPSGSHRSPPRPSSSGADVTLP